MQQMKKVEGGGGRCVKTFVNSHIFDSAVTDLNAEDTFLQAWMPTDLNLFVLILASHQDATCKIINAGNQFGH